MIETNTTFAALPVDKALTQLLREKREEIDRECERFLTVGDQESLHDLRVAMRRLHSLFVGFKDCFQREIEAAKELRQLFRQTNHARDLEVTLGLLEKHQLSLPWLQQRWQLELEAEYTHLRNTLPAQWQALSQQFEVPRELLADKQPAISLGGYAAIRIKGQRKELLKHIAKLRKNWGDKRAHKLRIRGKHLRYLLEPFAEQQPEAERAVNKLKRFQDRLGDYHDLVVLQQRLVTLEQQAPLNHYTALEAAQQQLKQERKKQRRTLYHRFLCKAERKLRKCLKVSHKTLAQA